jgi:uracil-DNA glycosylase
MDVRIEASWKAKLDPFFATDTFGKLTQFVKEEYRAGPVFPPGAKIFRAFDLCPLEQVKVVILGQDPYHGPGQANGLCFSVNPDVDLPPSLVNIFQELESDLGRPPRTDRTLEHWAREGVLLLNSTLTVRSGAPTSHTGRGWEDFTDEALKVVAARPEPAVFVLWGAYAQRKGAFLDGTKHRVIKSPHPSPLSAYRGFFGSRPFSRVNEALTGWGKSPIDW